MRRTAIVHAGVAALILALIPAGAAQEPDPGERFRVTAEHAFVDTATDQPVQLRGVNIKRATHRVNGVWQTPYVISEIDNMAKAGRPAFDTIRLAMDWPYFQRKMRGEIRMDEAAFAELDQVIAAAQRHGFHVILDPIHLANLRSYCTEDRVMNGAHRNIPAWAWRAVGKRPGRTCETADKWNNRTDDVLALQETADYLRFILDRYDTDTEFGQTVVALDLVNEPLANGTTGPNRTQRLVNSVFDAWLEPDGPKSLRAVDPDKPFIITPVGGSASLEGVNFRRLDRTNVIMTFHDYFGQATGTDAKYGLGYDRYGWATQTESTDRTTASAMGSGSYVPYDKRTKSYEQRLAEHREFLEQFVDDARAAGMPVYVGEYGIVNPCHGATTEGATRYFTDTIGLYDELGLSHTVWANGYWDDMSVMWRDSSPCGATTKWQYFDYALAITGGEVRPDAD